MSVTETASPLPGRMWRLDPVPSAAGQARGRLRTTLAKWGVDERTAADAELVLGELVSNAVVASRQVPGRPPPIGVSLAVTPAALTIEVLDRAPGAPVLLSADGADEGGRGLAIVEELTRGRWGARPGIAAGAKFVWAEISLNPSGEQPEAPNELQPQERTTEGTMPAAKPCLPAAFWLRCSPPAAGSKRRRSPVSNELPRRVRRRMPRVPRARVRQADPGAGPLRGPRGPVQQPPRHALDGTATTQGTPRLAAKRKKVRS